MSDSSRSTGLVIDGVIGAETIDSSGEMLIVEGCDISSMERDGVLNWEHLGEDAGPSAVIGKCVRCKKIYGPDDCDNAREREYWDVTKVPFIYAQFRLFDAQDGHAQAKAAAAIIRDQAASAEPLTLRFSLEGSTLSMSSDKRITESICRRCALTAKPCNKAAVSGVLYDPKTGTEEATVEVLKFEHPGYQLVAEGRAPGVVGDDLLKLEQGQQHEFEEVTPEEYERHLSSRADLGGVDRVRDYAGKRAFMNRQRTAGVVVHPAAGTIHYLFSLERGAGAQALMHGVRQGGRRLSAFDGGLAAHYGKHGFREVGREANWTPGGPDVVHMEYGSDQSGVQKAQAAVDRARELAKALSAGGYDAAPGTLTGGAALQREDLGQDVERRKLVAVCKAAVRDYDPENHGSDFRTYLKSLLPEASDEFLDRFKELADEVRVKGRVALAKASKDIAPYHVKHVISEPQVAHGGNQEILVTAHDSSGEEVGRAFVQFWKQGYPHVSVNDVFVRPEHRRRGVATAMYQRIEQVTGSKLVPSHDERDPGGDGRTSEGKALWAQKNRPFGKSELAKKVVLYRAADDDAVSSDSMQSFSESEDDARAYLDNPGYGGQNLYRAVAHVDPSKVLDVTSEPSPLRAANAILSVAGSHRDPCGVSTCELVHHNGIGVALREAGYHWLRVPESYPGGSATWQWLGHEEAQPPALELAKGASRDETTYWHGTPSGDLRGGPSGLHVGSRKAAEQALHARIGYPAEGQWDGTREYGKTKLVGRKTLVARGLLGTGLNASLPEEDHLPNPERMPVFSDGTPVFSTHKPDIFEVRIVGPMSNTPQAPHEDFKANGYMSGALRRGVAKRGYYYRNVGEDSGSISAVLPGESHVERMSKLAKKDAAAKPAEVQKPKRSSGTVISTRAGMEDAYQETLGRIRDARATSFPDEDEGGRFPPAESPVFRRAAAHPRQLGRGEVVVDEQRGVLHVGGTERVPPRAHKLYAPAISDANYMQHLTDPHLNEVHDRAMRNWVLMHRLNRAGKLPEEVVAHAAMFSLMSPNTSVPIQELAYAHLQDLQARGFDPKVQQDPQDVERYEREFRSMAQGQYLPEYMRDHFLSSESGIWRKPYEFEQPGEGPDGARRSIVGLTEPKWKGVAHYADLHRFLADAVRRYGVDAAGAAAELSALKNEKQKHQNRARVAEKAGRPAPEDPNADKPDVYGFAPKTLRYLYGMLGGGNASVPDTHFVRHVFGLHPDDPKIGDVKAPLTAALHEPALRSVDRWYRANHPAFEWTRQKLQKQYGEDFGEQATFPSFWMHWLTIAPHERSNKWRQAEVGNEGTDHEVFWNSVRSVLQRYGLPLDPHDPSLRKAEVWGEGGSLPARTAHAMRELEDRFGETAANFAYYSYLAPLLLAPSKPAVLYKAELLARLAKGEHAEEREAPKRFLVDGAVVEPGEGHWTAGPQAGNSIPVVALGKKWHKVLTESGNLSRLKADHPNFRLVREPKVVYSKTFVDSKKHGHPTLHGTAAQHDLVHGLDLAKRVAKVADGTTLSNDHEDVEGWYNSPSKELAFVKPAVVMDGDPDGFWTAHREAAFHRLADEFFGVGEHVPVTTVFRHPVSGSWLSAQRRVSGEHYSNSSKKHVLPALGRMMRSGALDRLALVDMILGNEDRHDGNYLVDGDHIHLIDNGLSFYGSPFEEPSYWELAGRYVDGDDWLNKPLHSAAVAWAETLEPQALAEHMDRLGVPKAQRDVAVKNLQALRVRLSKGPVSRDAAYSAPRTMSRGY